MVEKRALSQLSDDEVLALYKKHGDNCSAAAREVGCGPATFSQRMRLLNSDTYKASKERAEAVSFLMEELEARGVDPTTVNIKSATIVTRGTTKTLRVLRQWYQCAMTYACAPSN